MKRTNLVSAVLCLVLSCGLASIASAQAPTTVQLPTFSFFTVNTTVSVPDSGGSYLGGLMRGRDSSSTRGLGFLSTRGLSSERSAEGIGVRAWIHDFRGFDEALLAEAAAKRSETDPAALKGEALAGSLEKASGNSGKEVPLLSVAEIRRQNERQDQARRDEARAYFAKAEEYQAAGKLGLAKINFQRAAARDAVVKESALARIFQIQGLAAKKQDAEK
jgi:hypothetical protein